MTLVSVVVPVHNGERHLRQCLDSIIGQTLRQIEIIVVDDGSTDGTPQIIREYEARDSRVLGLAGPATGSAGSARNLGLDRASGEYLSFIDGDDYISPIMLEILYRQAVADNADVVLTKYCTIDDRTRELTAVDWALRVKYFPEQRPFSPQDVGDHLFYCTNPAAWNKIFRANYIRESGIRFQELRRTNDAFFTYSALAHADRLTYVDQHLMTYRIGNLDSLQGTVHKTPLEFIDALEKIRDRLKQTGRFSVFERAFANLALTLIVGNLNRSQTPEAFSEIFEVAQKRLFAEFGLKDRPSAYFVSKALARHAERIASATPEAWLFHRMSEIRRSAAASDELIEAPASPVSGLDPGLANTATAVAPVRRNGPIPDVSVIIPVYNSEDFLHECLMSVQAQTRVSLEIICVNDGSTDSSGSLLAQYAKRDSRIIVVNQRNAGLSGARNTGIGAATGRYLCFLDSDDFWRLDQVADLVKCADQDQLDLVLFDAESFRDPGVSDSLWEKYRTYYQRSRAYDAATTGPDFIAQLRENRDYRPSACLYLVNRRYLNQVGARFYPRLTHEDNLFTFHLLLLARRVAHRQLALYARRVRAGSIMSSGVRAASAHGYLITFVEMLKLVAGKEYPPKVAGQIGELVYMAFWSARNELDHLSKDAIENLRRGSTEPDVQAILEVLALGGRDRAAIKSLNRQLEAAGQKSGRGSGTKGGTRGAKVAGSKPRSGSLRHRLRSLVS